MLIFKKKIIEEEQRKIRKEKGDSHKPKYFEYNEKGFGWTFLNSEFKNFTGVDFKF